MRSARARQAAKAFKQTRKEWAKVKGRKPIKKKIDTMRRKPIAKKRAKPRRGPLRDRQYVCWLAQQPCFVTGKRPVTIHHVRRYGEPKNDRRTLPLIARLHMRTHELPGQPCIERGKAIFEKTYGVNIEAGIRSYNMSYNALYKRERART